MFCESHPKKQRTSSTRRAYGGGRILDGGVGISQGNIVAPKSFESKKLGCQDLKLEVSNEREKCRFHERLWLGFELDVYVDVH
jgi:hypothetical protein